MYRSNSGKGYSEDGQGLVEYSLILTLIAVVVVVVLVILGPDVGNVFSQVANAINVVDEDDTPVVENTDVVAITIEGYDPVTQQLHLHATSDGGNDPSVTMTASPGGVMMYSNYVYPHYHLFYTLPGVCPCEVTVTSSEGGAATVTVGP